jgi:Zn-dependent M28 family amino/carboxypeptidase
MAFKQRLWRLIAYPFLWPVIHMPGKSHSGPLALLNEGQQEMKLNLERHVRKLADEIGERNAHNYPGFLETERYITEQFRAGGYAIRTQSFYFDGVEMRNVEAELRGTELPDEIIVIGAHYDTVYGSPGADDNASGVAGLLELARLFASKPQKRTLRFVAFANEENPNAAWETMGSYEYARECKERNEKIVAMISLEMIGVYSDAPGSQRYPLPFSLLYPEVGNFIGFVSNLASGKFVRRCVGTFRQAGLFPSEGVAAPEFIRDIHRSDHWSFWQFGYPGLMLTDTSNFRNTLYHTTADVPAILDFGKMTLVICGIEKVVDDLCNN